MSEPLTRSEIKRIANMLIAAEQCARLYPEAHPRSQAATRDLYLGLRSLLVDRFQIRLALVDNELVSDQIQVPIEGAALEELARLLQRSGVGRVVFYAGIRRWEIEVLVQALRAEPATLAAAGGIEQYLASEGVRNLRAGPIRVQSDTVFDPDQVVKAWGAYSGSLGLVRRLRTAGDVDALQSDIGEAREYVADLADVASEEPAVLMSLHSLKQHDEYSFTHSVNVSMLSLTLASAMGLDSGTVHEIGLAALLHDVGKERVPGDLLRKPGSLDEEEWEVMSRHDAEGTKMLLRAEALPDLCAIVAFEHHFAADPDRAPWPAHLASQIVTVADCYDAMRSVRPYRGALPPDETLRMLEETRGSQFDPHLLDGFVKLVGYYPPGTCLRFASGAIGISVRSNPDEPRLPHVLVVRDADGEPVLPPAQVDLSDRDGPGGGPGMAIDAVVEGDEVGVDPFDYV